MAVSNKITALITFISILCSIPILASGIWLASKPETRCIRFLRYPLILLGSASLLFSLSGFLGSYYKKRGLLSLYLFGMAALIFSLIFVIIFASIVMRENGAYVVPGRAYREYRLEGYSRWLRDHVTGGESWGRVRECLVESEVCGKLSRGTYFSAQQFYYSSHLSPLESGCCKPPTICGYEHVNPTMWVNPTNAVSDPDCVIWNNEPTQLCYNCDSCKAGLLGNLRSEWRKAFVALIIALVLLILVYLVGCNAYKNTQMDAHRYYK